MQHDTATTIIQIFPNNTETLGSSTNTVVAPYKDFPLQAGNEYAAAHKFEYDNKTNKYSIPSLRVTATFDLVPSAEEAGVMDSEILAAGFDQFPRNLAQNWYPATQDDKHFYYSVMGGALFPAFFGFGTSSIFVCRRKKDASLVWVTNSLNYRVDDPLQVNYLGQTNTISRIALGIYGDRVYVTTMFTNIGPQLFCMNNKTGARIWSMAYYLPEQATLDVGASFIVAPTNVPFQSFDGSPYVGQSVAIGDLNVNVVKLAPDTVSVFVGVSSFQNAVNPAGFGGFARYTDQGQMIRVDDTGASATIVWRRLTVPLVLHMGDVISTTGPDAKNPFRPGSDIVYIWRDTTATGTFDAPGGVNALVLDYLGANPGYIPAGYPVTNNLTVPVIANIFLVGGAAPLTEGSFQTIFRTEAPGVGADAVLYFFVGNTTTGPVDMASLLVAANVAQDALAPGQTVKAQVWTYVTQDTITAVNVAMPGADNAGVRYIAALPDNYTITNEQEAEALNYYGNSVWGQTPTVDVARNLLYFGTGQTHGGPVDELLTFQAPAINYLDRKQPVIDSMYQYARPDDSTIGAPVSTLKDVNAAKDAFIASQAAINVDYSLKSPRGNMAYPVSMMGVDLSTGQLVFGYRVLAWDQVTFTSDDPSLVVIASGYVDGDLSSGIQMLQNVPVQGGGKRTILATMSKSSVLCELDISGLNRDIPFDNYNLADVGVVPRLYYGGPDGALGGSNYGLSQDGGSKLIWSSGNDSPNFGSYSFTYDTGLYQGYEFHVTRDGRVWLPNESFVAAYDASTKQIVWETSLGQLTHSQVQSYNGVSFVPRGDGVLFGFDTGSGEVVYKDDFHTLYNIMGITPPTFDSCGKGVFICNYRLPLVGFAGDLGSTGVLLDVNACNLPSPRDTVWKLVGGKTFDSFDVVPKSNGMNIFDELHNDQTVKHVWSKTGTLTATHVLYDKNDEVIETLNGTFKAETFIFASLDLVFQDTYSTDGKLRYVSLTFLSFNKYTLKFQILNAADTWTNYEATIKVVATTVPPHTQTPCGVSKVQAKHELSPLAAYLHTRVCKRENTE